MQKWKQVNGSTATYRNLIRVFEKAGYKGYADTVHSIISPGTGEYYNIIIILTVIDHDTDNNYYDKNFNNLRAAGPNAASLNPEGAHGGGVHEASPVQLVKPVADTGSYDVSV